MKRFALGIRTESKLNPSFNTVFFVCRETWDTFAEAEKYCQANPGWKTGNHPGCGILQLTDKEIADYSL